MKEKAKIKARLVAISRASLVLDLGVQDLELTVKNASLLVKAGGLWGKTVVVVIGVDSQDNGNDLSFPVVAIEAAPEEK